MQGVCLEQSGANAIENEDMYAQFDSIKAGNLKLYLHFFLENYTMKNVLK